MAALVWENLSCDGDGSFCSKLVRGLRTGTKKKQILTDLNGCLKFGELTALMGPSGAGKSTLLNCLTQGQSYNGTHGRIFAASKTQTRTVFITQNERDHLLLNLTVFESLYYASELKNPFKTTRLEHSEIVKQLLNELDLMKVEDGRVHSCSGGQKKRIAIGLELTAIRKPNFLFLDEPTSGLDSHSGYNVIYRLRNLAEKLNIAVVTVIHQPSFEIFSQFHNVYILSKVGRCVFSGSPTMLFKHLNNYGYESSNSNPADVIISIASCVSKEEDEVLDVALAFYGIVSANVHNIDIDLEQGDDHTGTIKKASEMKKDCEEMTESVARNFPKQLSTDQKMVQIQRHGLCSSGAEFKLYSLWVLLKRTCISSLVREKRLIFIRLALHLVVAVVLATLYNRGIGAESDCFDVNLKNCTNVQVGPPNENLANIKFQFFSLLFLMFAALMPTVLTFPAEIKLFINEHRNGWYSTSFYYISKTLVEIPFQLIFSFCYNFFLYWYSTQIGMDDWYDGIFIWTSWRYGYFLGVIVLSCFIAQGLGFLIGIICVNSFSMAIILSSTVLLFQFLFSGFFVKISAMDEFTKILTHLSFIRFSFESLLVILYGENRCQSDDQSAIMAMFGLSSDKLRTNLWWILGHLIATRVLAFVLLLKLANRNIISKTLSCPLFFDVIVPKLKKTRSYCCNSLMFLMKLISLVFLFQIVVVLPLIIVYKLIGNVTFYPKTN